MLVTVTALLLIPSTYEQPEHHGLEEGGEQGQSPRDEQGASCTHAYEGHVYMFTLLGDLPARPAIPVPSLQGNSLLAGMAGGAGRPPRNVNMSFVDMGAARTLFIT